jgi:hypothetical protein
MKRQPSGASSNESFGFQRPAPIGGWNTRDALATMPRNDAIILDNFFPGPGGLAGRKGYTSFATTPSNHPIQSLLPYATPGGTQTLFAVGDTAIYNITAGGAISTVSSVVTNAKWQYVNQTTAGGSFLWICNGVDKARYWDGAAWTILDTVSSPALTGVTSTSIINVSLFKTRLMLTCINSLSFWYLPVVAVAGAASEFPLGSVFKRGGYLMATESWTLDSGFGPDDRFAAVTSEGELVIYEGTDPSNAATWSLQGLFFVGKPLGRRCFVRIGGDLYVLTVGGIISLTKLLNSSVAQRTVSVSDKIDDFFSEVVAAYGNLFGWQAVVYPEAHLLLVNVPLTSTLSWQFAMNTDTGAWSRFTNQNSAVWSYFDGNIYFSLGSNTYKAWTGANDNGSAISFRAKTAFQSPAGGRNSQIRMVRPIFTSTAALSMALSLDSDYSNAIDTSQSTTFAQTVGLWDTALWDTATWSGNLTVSNWKTVVHKPGRVFSLRMQMSLLNVTVSWSATDFLAAPGGLI